MSYDTDEDIGFAFEVVEGTDPISLDTSLYWEFGDLSSRFSLDHPIEQHEIYSLYSGATRNPKILKVIKLLLGSGIKYLSTNAIGWYLLLGSSVSSGAPEIHTIDGLNTGSLPTITVRSEMRGGSVSEFIAGVGCKTRAYGIHFDLENQTNLIGSTWMFDSLGNQDPPTLNSAHTGLKFPTDTGAMNGTEQKNALRWSASTGLATWDNGGGEETEYKADIKGLNITGVNTLSVESVHQQIAPKYTIESDLAILFSFKLGRGADNQIYDHFQAQSQHDFLFKAFRNDGAQYDQVELTDCLLSVCRAPYKENHPYWLCQGLATDIQVVARDDIENTVYYGE